MNLHRPSFFTVNFIFLIDSLAYFVGYILFLRELEDVFNGSSYQRPAQVAVIRYAVLRAPLIFTFFFDLINLLHFVVKFLTPVMWMSLTLYFSAMKHCLQ